ncbi:MAG: glycoside hydrolase family 2 protein [Bacteroidaceae bacterium]|nr:glycoside hydrolase family 2 protein [Bacteroidaceae bacterium]
MKYLISTLWLWAFALTATAQTTETLLLEGWRFHHGAAVGAEAVSYNDAKWERVTIPHDWAIAGPFDKDIDKQVVAIEQNGEQQATEKTGRSGSLPWIGEGWYRTAITLPAGYSHAELIFDGAMSEPHVWVNGRDVGSWAYGYNVFSLDITAATDDCRAGTYPVAVHLQNVEESSRWYPGAGLYRPVRLVLHPEKYLTQWGTFARTTMLGGIGADHTTAAEARVLVSSDVAAPHKGLRVKQTLLLEGRVVAESTADVSDSRTSNNVLLVRDARLWSPETPVLYTLVTELLEGDRVWDRKQTPFGIRDIQYTAEGFRLNGQLRKFKGVCLHHDLGPLGAAFNKTAFRRQVRLLKDMGCDAIRTAHNTPCPWQMEICDEMGMMVMAESFDMWRYPKCRNGYSRFFTDWWERDITNLVLLNRNYACNVMYSIGNEIPEQGSAEGLDYSRRMQELIHRLDGTRPCTQGMDRGTAAMWSGVWQAMDVPGFNYRLHVYDEGHKASPNGIVLGSETASTVSSRGVYKFPVEENHGKAYPDGQISSYDLDACIWSNLPDDDWMWQDKMPWVIGEFVWTGFDYLGEPTPYDEYWPSRSSYFGIYDLAGLPKDRVYLYRARWNTQSPTLHILPHWTWPGREGEPTPVFVYTSFPEAELFVNGKSQGRVSKCDVAMDDYKAAMVKVPMPWGGHSLFADPDAPRGKNRLDRHRLRWNDVRYEPGELRVVAYDDRGRVAMTKVMKTAGKPRYLRLLCDTDQLRATPVDAQGRATDCPDLAFITVQVVDADGNVCPDAAQQLKFHVRGAGQFKACCNGDATSTEVFTAPTMQAFHGQAVLVVEAGKKKGFVEVTVSGKGLQSASAVLEVE